MSSRRAVPLFFAMAVLVAPLSAFAQAGGNNALQARVQALEATVAALQASLTAESTARAAGDSTLATNLASEQTARTSADTALSGRTSKLEGNIVAADLAGVYRARGVMTDLEGGATPSVTHVALNANVTLNTNGTGTIVQAGAVIQLMGPIWIDDAFNFDPETINVTWSYANGFVHITDGTTNLDINLAVGAGGRVLIYSGLSDDNTIDIIVATRLQ